MLTFDSNSDIFAALEKRLALLEPHLEQLAGEAVDTKPPTLRWLLHSYSTHFMEARTILRYFHKLLGHNSSKTNEIYTNLSKKKIQEIGGSIDELMPMKLKLKLS